jgi:hypothetical protein
VEAGPAELEHLKNLTAAHVEATRCLIHKHFPHLLPLLKFSSKLVEDLQEVLSSGSDFAFVFRGTYPGAYGGTFGSRTDINLRRGIGIPNLCRLYQDLLAFETECTGQFSCAGGDATFRDVTEAIKESPEWLQCVQLSDAMYHQSLKIITASGKHCMSAMLSQPVKECLTSAGVAVPATQFVFSCHASSLRGRGNDRSALISNVHFSECRTLRIQAEVIRGSYSTEDAGHMVDTAMRRNHAAMTEFCTKNGIVPVRRSFMYCPHDVVETIFRKMNVMDLREDRIRREMGQRLWLSDSDYETWRSTTFCADPTCDTQPSFNVPGQPAKYCKEHAKPGMKDVRSGTCADPTCYTQPSFNVPGQPAKYCKEHATPGMEDVRNATCADPNCHKHPSFNVPGQPVKYCKEHAKPGMKDVTHATCADPTCDTQPSFNVPGQPAKYCKEHAKPGMKDVRSGTCADPTCDTRPSFNVPGQPAKYCKEHAKPGMKDVRNATCADPNCHKYPSFNVPGQPAKYCKEHAKPGMENVRSATCADPNCHKHPSFNVPGQPAKYCKEHATPGMENVKDVAKKARAGAAKPG